MRRFLRWVVGIPIAFFVISFAIANRRWVTLSLDPFSADAPFASVDLPLWLLFFLGILVGLLVGWLACWLAQGKWRRAARDYKAEMLRLNGELAEMQRHQPQPQLDPPESAPFGGGFL